MIWRLEYENAHGDVARLDIQRGAATPVEIIEGTENPFLLSYELEGKNKKGFIMSSFADISIYETATFNIDDLKTLDETALSVKWYINSVLEWTGFVVPDFFSRTIGEPAIVNLAASDRLSSLKDATLDGLSEYVKLKDLAIACLAKTGLSLPLITTVDFKADTTNIMDAFALSERLEDDKGKKISCFDVLRSILVLTNSTIRQRKGQWRIYNKIQHEAVAPTLNFDEVYQGGKRTIQPVFSSVGAFQEFGGIKIYPKNNTFSNSAAGWVAENGFVTEFDNRELNYTSPDLPPTFGEETNKINLINRNIWIPGSFDTAKKLSSPPFKVPFRGADRVAFTLEINASAAPNQRFRYALIKRVNGVPVSFMRNDDTWLQGPGSGSYSGSWSFFPRQKDGEPYSSVDAIFTINANVSLEESEDPEKVTLTVHILGVDSYAPAGVQTLVSAIRSMTVKFDEKNDAKGILYRTDQLGNFSKKSDPNTTIFGDHISRGLNGYFYPYAEDDTSVLRSPSGLNLPLYKWTTATDPAAGELPILQHVTRQMSRMFGVAHNVLSAVIDAKTFDPLAIVTNCAGEKYVIVYSVFDFLRSTVEVELQQIAYGSLQRRDFIFSYFGGGDGDGISSIGSVSGGGSSSGGGGIPQTLDLLVDELFISGGNSVDLGVYARKTWVETEATAFNSARLGGYSAASYPRKAENAVITGAWKFLSGENTELAIKHSIDATAKNRSASLILGRNASFFLWRMSSQSDQAWGNSPNLHFENKLADTGAWNKRVTILSNGNVGFGITPTERLHVAGNGLFTGAVTAGGNVGGAGTFVGGFAGSNWRLEQANNHLTVDSLTVRGQLSVYELVVNQIRATNGSLWVSDSMKTTTIALLATNSYRLTFDRDNGRIVCTFAVNDIIKAQRFDGKNVVVVVGRVTAFNNTNGTIDISTAGYTAPVGTLSNFVGLDFVRIGNTEVTNRQGALYLTSSDNNAPYLDVLDGVNSASFAGKTKVRIGRLDGITDPDLGTLSGYGLYTENGYFKGRIQVTGGNAATKADVDAVQVGGRNYLKGSAKFDSGNWFTNNASYVSVESSDENGINQVKHIGDSYLAQNTSIIGFDFSDTSQTFTISVYAKCELSGTIGLTLSAYHLDFQPKTLTKEWARYTWTFKGIGSSLTGFRFRVPSATEENPIYIKKPAVFLGNRATDWTPAPEDVDAGIAAAKQEALTAAGNAQSTANSASSAVGNLSGYVDGAFKDEVIDTAEAKAIEKYKNSLAETKLSVDGAYTQLYNNTYLEGSAKSNLSAAKTALNTAYTNLVNSINTAIADGKTTAAEKSYVDSKFGLFNTAMATYQVRAEEAKAAINVKLDTISKGYVDAIEIGGVNLLKDTNRETTVPYNNTSKQTEYVNAERGKQYALSFDIKATGNYQGNTLLVQYYDANNTRLSFEWVAGSVTTQYQRLSKIITMPTDPAFVKVSIGYRSTTPASQANTFKCLQLEKGNKVSAYKPSPEDVPSALEYLATALVGDTNIAGGLVTTNLLMVKDSNGTVRGGISGLKSDNVGFWTGGDYQNAVTGSANVIFRKDGSFSLAGGKISGTAAGAATIEGGLITGAIESSNWDGEKGSSFDLHNGHLLIGDAIRMSGDVSEILVRNRDTGLDSFRIGDFPLTPTNFAGAGVDVLLSSSPVTVSAAAGSYQLNRTVYVSSSGALMTSTAYVSDSLTVGGSYSFRAFLKVALSSLYHMDTIPGYIIGEGFVRKGGNGINMQLKNYNTVVWEQNITAIPANGVIPLAISTSFQAVSPQLQLIIMIDGEFAYLQPDGANTKLYNTSASIERSNNASRLVLQALLSRMEFSTKGMQAIFSNTNYFRCDSNYIEGRGTHTFISPNGNYRLRISNDRIEKGVMTNGVILWTAL